jgi:hypothetical protein
VRRSQSKGVIWSEFQHNQDTLTQPQITAFCSRPANMCRRVIFMVETRLPQRRKTCLRVLVYPTSQMMGGVLGPSHYF